MMIRTAAFLMAIAVPLGATRLPARVFTTVDGLGSDAVKCAMRDSKGFLWFCTTEGISRYDGYQFVTYGVAQGLQHRSVNAVLETRAGTYVIGTDLGVSRLDPAVPATSSKRFVPVPPADNAPTPGVLALIEDRNGVVWSATTRGLYRIDGADGARPALRFVDLGRSLSGGLRSIAQDGRGTLWIASSDGLCSRSADGRVQWYSAADSGLPAEQINVVLAGKFGDVWVGTLDGLWRFPIATGPIRTKLQRYDTRDGLPSARIHSLLESSSSDRVWVGTSQGMAEFSADGKFLRSYDGSNGLSGRAVLAIGEDKSGTLWVGVDHGLTRIARDGFATFTDQDGVGNRSIVQVGETGDSLWTVSNETSSLVLYEFRDGRFRAIRPMYPRSMHYFGWATGRVALRDRDGEWWIATGEGICRFARVASISQLASTPPKAVYTTRDGLPSNDILRLYEDSRGNIWIATHADKGELTRWDRHSGSFVRYSFEDSPGMPSAFTEDRAGNLWIGFSNEEFSGRPSGLLRYRDGKLQVVAASVGVPLGYVTALQVDRDGKLWIGSTDGGLARIDHPEEENPRVERYSGAALSSLTVHGIAQDHLGRIYFGTPRGVDRIEPESGRIKHFTAIDGLASGTPAAIQCDHAGRIWVGTSMGLSVVDPAPDAPGQPLRIFIEGLTAGGEPRAVAEPGVKKIAGLRLDPDQNQLSITFAGIGAAPGEPVQYQYRLEGGDPEWSTPTEQRTVSYARLGAGRFRFLVRGVSSGSASPEPAEVSFEILAPLWQRTWFVSMIAMLATLLALLAHRYDVVRRLEIERIRLTIARDLHDDLGARLSRVAILSELAQRGAGGHLSEIADLARGMVDGLGDLVWAIDPRRDDLPSMARQVRRYASDVLTAHGIGWTFDTPDDSCWSSFGPEQRRHLLLIFQEAIRNAARHSGCSEMHMSLTASAGECIARIHDDGRGLPHPLPESGEGLQNMRTRAAILGGACFIESRPGEGVEIIVRFPIAAAPRWRGRIRMLFRSGTRIGANRS
jgi:signal transduction histidine kinase/streptogramin lyase